MGPGHAGAGGDLDALIGEIRREAARRRAAPDFPLDEEARLAVEMDREGPAGSGGADLAAVTAELHRMALGGDGGVGQVAGLTASAVRALALRLTELERRSRPARSGPAAVTGITTPAQAASADSVSAESDLEAGPDAALFGGWVDEVATLVADGGRVLVAGPGAARWVEHLAGAGKAAYGVDPTGSPYGDSGPVRSGPVLEHLRAVGDGALALVALVGPPATDGARTGDGVAAIATELTRATARVAVCSEAPWAWRRRIGDVAADLSHERPVGPETWLEALDRAGFAGTARYGPGGLTYIVAASAPSGGAASDEVRSGGAASDEARAGGAASDEAGA